MKKLLAVAVLLTALFATQNANGQEMVQQTNENTFVLAQTENINVDNLEIAITSVPTNSTVNSAASGCGMTYSYYKDGEHHYIKYNNPTKNYVLIYYTYTIKNGDEYSSFIEAKPEVSTNVNIYLGEITCKITGCKISN
jgi:hypothetical protein